MHLEIESDVPIGTMVTPNYFSVRMVKNEMEESGDVTVVKVPIPGPPPDNDQVNIIGVDYNYGVKSENVVTHVDLSDLTLTLIELQQCAFAGAVVWVLSDQLKRIDFTDNTFCGPIRGLPDILELRRFISQTPNGISTPSRTCPPIPRV